MTLTRSFRFTFSFLAMLLLAIGLPSVNSNAQSAPAEKPKPADPPPATAPDDAKLVYVLMSTSKGDILLELNQEKAPITVANFLSYTEKKHYDGTVFHRIMADFMIQGGGQTADGKMKPTDPPIKNEWKNGLKNERGTIAMARTAQPNTATSQFFINVKDNPMLDEARGNGAAYCVFGKVVAGMATVDTIRLVPTSYNAQNEKSIPNEPVEIKTVRRVTEDEAKKLIAAEGKTESAPAAPKS